MNTIIAFVALIICLFSSSMSVACSGLCSIEFYASGKVQNEKLYLFEEQARADIKSICDRLIYSRLSAVVCSDIYSLFKCSGECRYQSQPPSAVTVAGNSEDELNLKCNAYERPGVEAKLVNIMGCKQK